jgi:hypothetical protein
MSPHQLVSRFGESSDDGGGKKGALSGHLRKQQAAKVIDRLRRAGLRQPAEVSGLGIGWRE